MTAGRVLAALGGLFGAAGVALAAMAAHAGGDRLATASDFLLFHAAALLALGLAGRGRAIHVAGFALALGVALFCGDLVMRDMAGHSLFAMAAPTGGTLSIAAWLGVAIAVLVAPRPSP